MNIQGNVFSIQTIAKQDQGVSLTEFLHKRCNILPRKFFKNHLSGQIIVQKQRNKQKYTQYTKRY